MDSTNILQLLDEERRVGTDVTATLERTPEIVRCLSANWNGIVYSHFSDADADRIIDTEIERFSRIGNKFEWKVYSHDEPRNLLAKLTERGFRPREEEALMIAPLTELSKTLFRPISDRITINEVIEESMIEDVFEIEAAVWKSSHRNREEMIANINDPIKRDVGFIAYFDGKPVGFARVTTSPESRFAGLWGGSVVEQFRGQGIYRALLRTRIVWAQECPSVEFLRVDALPTSRPILEKYGFSKIASTWPYEWSENLNV
jgi:GNAT superfamily N-acetyltransferase